MTIADRIARALGAIVFGIIGWQVTALVPGTPSYWLDPTFLRYGIPLAIMGAAIGALITPWLTVRPALYIRSVIGQLPTIQLVAGTIGLTLGLAVSALLAIPLSRLPSPFGEILPLICTLIFAYLGIAVLVLRQKDIFALFGGSHWLHSGRREEAPVLLDTSVIIDGRIADICQTGFIRGPLIVPRFVLNELQHIADSSDPLRRNRGRRGLDMLNKLKQESTVAIRFVDIDVNGISQVDEKLIHAAKQLECPIVTNDFNLNRIARLQGITVLNINELANAVKAVVLPGESMRIRIIQEGKESGQGVGYLEDGTMVVVENGRRHMNQDIDVLVTKVLQTNAGRMIFAQPNRDASR